MASCNTFPSEELEDPLSAATLTCILLVVFSLCLIGCSGHIDPIAPPPGRGTFYPMPQIRWQLPMRSDLQRGWSFVRVRPDCHYQHTTPPHFCVSHKSIYDVPLYDVPRADAMFPDMMQSTLY